MYFKDLELNNFKITKSGVLTNCRLHNIYIEPGVSFVAFINCTGMNIEAETPVELVFDDSKIMNVKFPEGTRLSVIKGKIENMQEFKIPKPVAEKPAAVIAPVESRYKGEIVTPSLNVCED